VYSFEAVKMPLNNTLLTWYVLLAHRIIT